MEEILPETTLTQEEKDCEKHFQESHARDETGRYIVKLPMRANGEKMIGESFEMAKRRFLQLERRLMKDNDLYASYREVIRKYLDLQYLEEIPFQKDNMIDSSSCIKTCYIPHHPVIKQSSSSTKVRPVFDGSAKTSTGFSLNDSLLVGPVIQDTLFNLVLRFRSNEVALVADIEKMYLQVKVHHDDTPLQRIIWRFNKDDELKVYELKRVTFGLAPSSFLATRVLSQLAADEGLRYPAGQKALQESFYVDDFLGGTNDKVKASELVRELVELLQKGGFCLKKWSSNVPEVLNELPSIDKAETHVVGLGPAEFVKTLGLCWYPATDELSIVVNTNGSPMQLTKRVIHSFIAKLFDPLGLIGPIIIWAKIRMQHLWIIKCDWDDPLPLEVTKKWNIFLEQLPHIDRIRVIRHVFVSKEASIQLHCFCDASEAAYGACIYARSRSSDDVVVVRLLASKSKPAPLKRVSLPRLELCAAVLGARLFRKVGSGLKMEISDAFFWSDSAIVLHWLKSPSYSWSTYVANRVSEIQDTTKEYRWLHIKGSENPADAISRGLLPEELAKSRLWFEGPEWLIEPMDKWKCQLNADLPAEEDLERRRTVLTVAPTEVVFPLLERYSSFWKTIRIAAYCIRFARRCQQKSTESGNIANGEFRRALKVLVKSLQSFEFAEEISDLRKGKSISSRSRLKLLRPFLDDEGVLRVGGRLSQIEMKYSAKHPMIVPAKHHFTRLMAKSFHEMTLHSGPRLTLATMRQEIWPLHGKALANYICRSCHQCFKVNPSPIQQPIGQLPALRAKSIKPFSVAGVDFCGPVHLKPVHRKAAAVKTYIAIYVCFSTKAVHIELASDLSTQAFLATFHRFIARRGLPTDIYSDNGLNFRGASNDLQEIGRLLEDPQTQSEICSDALKRNVEWHFIPPRAPNFGGLWEAAVKVAKRTLYKILGTRQLSFGDMTTVLTQIEAQMNFRPLTPLSDDPRELDVLTPGHFLIGSSMLTFPEPDFTATPSNRLKHYQQLQQLVQQHWQRWRKEYLCELHNVYQNQGKLHNIRLGEMVILKEDHKIMNEWFLGRIVGLHPGKDSVVRVVSVQTQRGVYKRPVSRICPLPFEKEVKTLNENH